MPRPAGDVRMALAVAAAQGPGTLRELAQRSQVGFDAARRTIGNMCRATPQQLRVVGERHVCYRNKLVQVYELALPLQGVAQVVAATTTQASTQPEAMAA